MQNRNRGFIWLLFSLTACSASPTNTGPANKSISALEQKVFVTEQAFAATMAARDYSAFQTFLADDAIFFNGPQILRGKDNVAAVWRRYFESEAAPFSWQPEQVTVLDRGDLALSSGPVLDPAGNLIGRFNSIWRRQGDGDWQIVFDKGSEVCRCE